MKTETKRFYVSIAAFIVNVGQLVYELLRDLC